MYMLLLVLHVGAALLTCIYIPLAILGAYLRRGSIRGSRWVVALAGGGTLVTGIGLAVATGRPFGPVCLPAASLLLAAWALHRLLMYRVRQPLTA